MKKLIITIILILVSPFILYEIALFVMHDFNLDSNEIDSCLDRGGRWNYEQRYCEHGDLIEFIV